MSAIRRLDRLLAIELAKPEDKHDLQLIDEYVKAISHFNACAMRLRDINATAVSKFRLQRVAMVACFMLAMVFAMGGIAQTMGVNVWSAVAHWDANCLTVNYGLHAGDDLSGKNNTSDAMLHGACVTQPSVDDGGLWNGDIDRSTEVRECETVEEALSYLGVDVALPTALPEGCALTLIQAKKVSATSRLALKYKSEQGYVNIEVFYVPEEELTYVARSFMHSAESSESVFIDGVMCYICKMTSDVTLAVFADGGAMYKIETNIARCDMKEIIHSALGSNK